MFVGCSEISISVIVKHVQHMGIDRALSPWGGLISFSVPGGALKNAGLWFARGCRVITQAYTMGGCHKTLGITIALKISLNLLINN